MTFFSGHAGPAPRVVLVASDMHLTDACDDEMAAARFRAADAAFRRLLRHHGNDARKGALLVLNGDTFDFLRVRSVPGGPAEYSRWAAVLPDALRHLACPAGVARLERIFGFTTQVHKSIWKMHVIAQAHPDVFIALARWLQRGGRLLILTGNHDAELHWPEVQAAVLRELANHCDSPADVAQLSRRVAFSHVGVTLANICIEHGHRWQPANVVGGNSPADCSGDYLKLPLGALASRYIVGLIERGVRRRVDSHHDGFAAARSDTNNSVRGSAVALLAAAYGFADGLIAKCSAWRLMRGAELLLVNALRERANLRSMYVVMGHTHVPMVEEIVVDHGRALYVNTGAWCAPGSRLRAATNRCYRFARFARERDVYSLSSLIWDDETNHLNHHQTSPLRGKSVASESSGGAARGSFIGP